MQHLTVAHTCSSPAISIAEGMHHKGGNGPQGLAHSQEAACAPEVRVRLFDPDAWKGREEVAARHDAHLQQQQQQQIAAQHSMAHTQVGCC